MSKTIKFYLYHVLICLAYAHLITVLIFTTIMDHQNLALALGVALAHNHSDILHELQQLKKKTAKHVFFNSLQTDLNYINAEFVKCTCDRCMDMIGANYPKDVLHDVHSTEAPHNRNMSRWWGPEDYNRETPRDNHQYECRLYTWLKRACVQFGVLLPDDSIEGPGCGPRFNNLTQMLGICPEGHQDNNLNGQDAWNYRLQQLDYPTQVRTLYHMIYYIHTLVYAEEATFDQWFHVENQSLLPYTACTTAQQHIY